MSEEMHVFRGPRALEWNPFVISLPSECEAHSAAHWGYRGHRGQGSLSLKHIRMFAFRSFIHLTFNILLY